jgi:RimJ/RimL family protein N-acetyltransferase
MWPRIERIESARLLLEPISVLHADEMVDVLADPMLYQHIGGEPPSVEQLRARYAALSVGTSRDGSQGWLNWIVKRHNNAAVGYVQATVEHAGDGAAVGLIADIAWVVSPDHQGEGLASEGAIAMARWLRSAGVNRFAAYVHPEHRASQGVARNVGLHPTGTMFDGEERWES